MCQADLPLGMLPVLLELGRVRHAQRAADGYAPVRQRVSMVAATA